MRSVVVIVDRWKIFICRALKLVINSVCFKTVKHGRHCLWRIWSSHEQKTVNNGAGLLSQRPYHKYGQDGRWSPQTQCILTITFKKNQWWKRGDWQEQPPKIFLSIKFSTFLKTSTTYIFLKPFAFHMCFSYSRKLKFWEKLKFTSV